VTTHSTAVVREADDEPLGREAIARLVAADIPRGSYVNLGIGQPTRVADYLSADSEITLHTENGMLGMGPQAEGNDIDPDLINAGKVPVTELPGASYFHHADSFAMMCGGHLDVCVLGAFQVAVNGDLANWHTGSPDAIQPWVAPWTLRSGERRLRDDVPLHQGRQAEARPEVHLSSYRTGLRQPGLYGVRRLPAGGRPRRGA